MVSRGPLRMAHSGRARHASSSAMTPLPQAAPEDCSDSYSTVCSRMRSRSPTGREGQGARGGDEGKGFRGREELGEDERAGFGLCKDGNGLFERGCQQNTARTLWISSLATLMVCSTGRGTLGP